MSKKLSIKGRVFVMFLITIVMTGNQVSYSSAVKAASDEDNSYIKEVELPASAWTIRFTLESSKGPFNSYLQFPNGYKTPIIKSDKKKDSNDAVQASQSSTYKWQVTYSVNKASAGKYRFFIDAEKDAEVRITYHVPLFRDINNHWAEAEIASFVKQGIVTGVGNHLFVPDRTVTKEAFIKMLVMMLTREQEDGDRQWIKEFRWKVVDEQIRRELGWQSIQVSNKSTKDTHWSQPYIEAVSHIGIKLDNQASELRRDEAAVIMYAFMRLADEQESKQAFKADWSEHDTSIAYSKRFGIMSGYPDGEFKPEKTVTRAEAVVMLNRLYQFFAN